MDSPFDHLLGGADSSESSDDTSDSPSPSSDNSTSPSSQSPPPSSPPPSTPSAPPPKSSGSGSPPPSPPSPSQSPSPPTPSQSPSPPTPTQSPSPPTPSQSPSPPTPSQSPPVPSTPQESGGSPPAPPLDRGAPAAPSRALPTPPLDRGAPAAPSKHAGGESSSESGGSRSSRGKSGGGSNDDGSAPVGAIVAGVVIGVLAFGLLMAMVACVCCARRKKKRPPHMHMPYYTDEHGNVFFANSMPKWQNSSAMDGGHGGWHAPYSAASGEFSGSHGPPPLPPSPGMPALGFSKSAFSYDELASATGGFAAANLLGQGGFGYVYRGVLPGSGTEVAVKQLKAGSGQGEREFQAEVEIISRVHHRHLVTLVGYCIAGASQRMLVYEFVPNDTLEHHLHGKGVPVMDWTRRLAIALGSAKGLAYLHEDCHPRIIHRDIKAANILLDENFEAKVADFGLAKLTTDTNTHVSTRVMGTFGYLAPEYASSGKLTDKSDVFSFGVMLLELITGKRPVDPTNYMEDSLVDWARPLLARALSEDGNFDDLIDPRLENKVERLELERMAACAAAAVRHSAKRRPKMKQIVRALEGDASLDDLNEGVKPGQSMMFSSSSEYDSAGGNYASNISKFRKVAFDSSEYSNEYSVTSEYGLNPSQSSAESGEPPRRQRH